MVDRFIYFVHAAAAKRTLSHLGMHGAVVRLTFVFWWMNPLAGIGVLIARSCSETQILSSRNCSAHCTGRFNAHVHPLFLLCFAIQGCAGLRILIVFCNSGLRLSACSYCVL